MMQNALPFLNAGLKRKYETSPGLFYFVGDLDLPIFVQLSDELFSTANFQLYMIKIKT